MLSPIARRGYGERDESHSVGCVGGSRRIIRSKGSSSRRSWTSLPWRRNRDPFEFRRRRISTGAPRHKAVLELAASMAGWGTPPAAGPRARYSDARGDGFHCGRQVAEVSLDSAGHVRRATKFGARSIPARLVNPATFVAARFRVALFYGLTAALFGEISIDKGRVGAARIFRTMENGGAWADAPEHQVRFIESGARTGRCGASLGPQPIAARCRPTRSSR